MRTDEGTRFPANTGLIAASDFGHFVTPFADQVLVKLTFTAKDTDNAFGFSFANDPVLSKPYISNIRPNSPASRLPPPDFVQPTKLPEKYRVAYLVEINKSRI